MIHLSFESIHIMIQTSQFDQFRCDSDKQSFSKFYSQDRERNGSVVECLTGDRRAVGASLTSVTVLWSLSKTHLS